MPGELIIGLMSGTSVDGIDAALVEFDGPHQLQVKHAEFTPFESELQQAVNALAHSPPADKKPFPKTAYAKLEEELVKLYAQASLSVIKNSGVSKKNILAIANHGQTIQHEPATAQPFTLQIGDPQSLANMTDIRTIANFRQADVANGGQGAPLMPAFHQAIFGANKANSGQVASHSPSYVLNLGGIANITALPISEDGDVVGFDTGPANTLMNQWIQKHLRRDYDTNGDWAATGKSIPDVLAQLRADPFFQQAYPKSTGTDYFNLEWLAKIAGDLNTYKPEDIQATLLQLTSSTIADAIDLLNTQHYQRSSQDSASSLHVCGGGAQNSRLINQLKQDLPSAIKVVKTDELGVPADWVEAAGFAWLGYCYLNRINSNLPSVTGARKALVLGEEFNPA